MNDQQAKRAAKYAAVETEAKRLLDRIKALRAAEKANDYACPRESGAVRRASMDLTRALADLRKPDL